MKMDTYRKIILSTLLIAVLNASAVNAATDTVTVEAVPDSMTLLIERVTDAMVTLSSIKNLSDDDNSNVKSAIPAVRKLKSYHINITARAAGNRAKWQWTHDLLTDSATVFQIEFVEDRLPQLPACLRQFYLYIGQVQMIEDKLTEAEATFNNVIETTTKLKMPEDSIRDLLKNSAFEETLNEIYDDFTSLDKYNTTLSKVQEEYISRMKQRYNHLYSYVRES